MTEKATKKNIQQYLLAGFPFLWVRTLEPDRAIADLKAEIAALETIESKKRCVATWDCVSGVTEGDKANGQVDPLAPWKYLGSMPDDSIMFFVNYHRFINPIEIVETIRKSLDGENAINVKGKCAIIISPTVALPLEIERLFTVVEFDLPDREKIIETIKFVCESAEQKLPENGKLATIVEAATGLTAHEAENAFSLSLSSKGCLDPTVICGQKAQLVKKNASLDFSTFKEGFNSLGGMNQLKDFSLRTIMSPHSRGIVLLGPPGTGKSHFAKALGNEVGLPTLLLDFGRMFGSLVGQSEERIRQSLGTADAMSPCVLFIDEMEKGLSGMASSGSSDGGTGSRVFSTFLTWCQDHTSKVYIVGTVNDVHKIAPEFLRAERWDAMFFIDLPTEKERMDILKIWMDFFKLPGQEVPPMISWTGAEIRSLCRIAAMLKSSLVEAAGYIVPQAISAEKEINALREFAKDRTLPASVPDEDNEPRRRKIRVAEPTTPPITTEEINKLYDETKGGKA